MKFKGWLGPDRDVWKAGSALMQEKCSVYSFRVTEEIVSWNLLREVKGLFLAQVETQKRQCLIRFI